MKKLLFIQLIFLILLAGCKKPTQKIADYPINAVPIRNVILTDSFWLPIIKTIQEATIQYAFDKCAQEGRMDNFLIAGGKIKGKTKGKMPFDDTDLYKIIEGASYSLISNPDPQLEAYIDSIITIIKIGQEPDGYLTTWFTIDPASPPAWWVKPSTYRWENEISSHELYNSGHLFEAAAAHYLTTGKRNFLNIALKNADLLAANFGSDKNHTVPGHQIVETGLIKLYRITHDAKYLELAKFFLDERGDSINHKLYGAYNQDHRPVIDQDEVVGHAVRGVYMYAAMTDIAAIYHDTAYKKAVDRLWENMVYKKLYLTGGIGARHDGEAFGDNYELPNLTAYSETCAAIGSVYWNRRLFLLTGDVNYCDIIERTLYNGLISGISTNGTLFFYPNPLESDGKYTFNHGSCTRQEWFDCSCCPTNLIRFIPSIPELIYSVYQDTLFVNLYISNQASATIGKLNVNIKQETNYPLDGQIRLKVEPEKNGKFTLKLRVPYWLRNQVIPGDLYYYADKVSGEFQFTINDVAEKPVIRNGYIEITRKWSTGDVIGINFPMQVRRIIANEKVIDDINKTALEYGPLVYCAEEIDNIGQIDKLTVNDTMKFQLEKKADLLGGINVISGETDQGKYLFIPYYRWSNRGVGKMKVWFPSE